MKISSENEKFWTEKIWKEGMQEEVIFKKRKKLLKKNENVYKIKMQLFKNKKVII